MKVINRRQFITVAGRAIPITIGVPYLIGCSNSPESMVGPDGPNPPNDGSDVIVSVSTVNSGHSHNATIPGTDVASTLERSYGSTAASGHTHTVTFTAADFETLRTAGQVTIASSSNSGHTHSLTFRT